MSISSPAQSEAAIPSVVLLVEDNAIIAMNTEVLLLDMGIADVKVAASVAEALSFIEATHFDLALLDLQLGEETSLPVAERLNEDKVRIVFATGFGEDAGLPAPFCDMPMLRKPYNFEDLERMVRGEQ